jgi:hypothetical protein
MPGITVLLDTNILIPLDPISDREFAESSDELRSLARLLSEVGGRIIVHPASSVDIERDEDVVRKNKRFLTLQKYQVLELPERELPHSPELGSEPTHRSNDWVDNELLKAALHGLVTILVSEDRKIHSKAKRLNIHEKVLFLDEAVEFVTKYLTTVPVQYSDAEFVHPLDIDLSDSFFNSLSGDYQEFFDWYKTKVVPEKERKIIVIREKSVGAIAALTILKPEDSVEYGPKAKTLKICTFKVVETSGRRRFGELLLKNILLFCKTNCFEYTYLTAFERHSSLIDFLSNFGFEPAGRNDRGELILRKRLKFTAEEFQTLSSIDFNRCFGPFVCNDNFEHSFLVPIQPQYHLTLFPEIETQIRLFNNDPPGNSIRKSYISRAKIKKIVPGDLLFFYRSGKSDQVIHAVAVVEAARHISEINDLVSFVGNRTVYPMDHLKAMLTVTLLCVNFRVLALEPSGIKFKALRDRQLISGYPQSIVELSKGCSDWLLKELQVR